jgi:hypothetical protein
MTSKQVANILENKFKGDLHCTVDKVIKFIEEEIKPHAFLVKDVSNDLQMRVIKATIQVKKGRTFEYYIKP